MLGLVFELGFWCDGHISLATKDCKRFWRKNLDLVIGDTLLDVLLFAGPRMGVWGWLVYLGR